MTKRVIFNPAPAEINSIVILISLSHTLASEAERKAVKPKKEVKAEEDPEVQLQSTRILHSKKVHERKEEGQEKSYMMKTAIKFWPLYLQNKSSERKIEPKTKVHVSAVGQGNT